MDRSMVDGRELQVVFAQVGVTRQSCGKGLGKGGGVSGDDGGSSGDDGGGVFV